MSDRAVSPSPSPLVPPSRFPGLVAKVPNAQPLYTGPGLDRMFLTEAGVVWFKGGQLELAAITRGPFFRNSATSEVVFAIDRGKGATLGPTFASRPGITPDALVTVTVDQRRVGNGRKRPDISQDGIVAVQATTFPWHLASLGVIRHLGMVQVGVRDHDILGELLVFERRR